MLIKALVKTYIFLDGLVIRRISLVMRLTRRFTVCGFPHPQPPLGAQGVFIEVDTQQRLIHMDLCTVTYCLVSCGYLRTEMHL